MMIMDDHGPDTLPLMVAIVRTWFYDPATGSRLVRRQTWFCRRVLGKDGQRILVGDTVQTRRNDRSSGVENRATWIVRAIHNDSVDLASVADSSDLRRISHDYAADHLHLAYATTAHGIQGETVDDAIVGPGVDAAGLYVGLTRGRARNTVMVVASTKARATQRLAETMLRAGEEATVSDAARAARRDLTRSAQEPVAASMTKASSASSLRMR
jgi:ATP-dependent exoDNAse (exonuclease V) alpha subunit